MGGKLENGIEEANFEERIQEWCCHCLWFVQIFNEWKNFVLEAKKKLKRMYVCEMYQKRMCDDVANEDSCYSQTQCFKGF